MSRTLLAFALAAAVVAPAWLRLERGGVPGEAFAMVALALVPTLAVALGRGRAGAAVALLGSSLVAASVAFGLSPADARPGEEHDFFGPVLSSFRQGFLEFFDARVPFDPVDFPLMHGVVLLAVFGFVAAAGMAVAARQPFAALAAILVGAGWPATMVSTWVEASRPLVSGALILAAALGVLFLLKGGNRGLAHAAAACVALVAVSVAASTSEAVAKRGFIEWDTWDLYDRPDDPVSVRYVWDANYDGISYPKKKTVVLKIRVPGPRRSLYWRATTLDEYTGLIWREELEVPGGARVAEEIDVGEIDPLLPAAARERKNWVRQDVEVEALKDNHLVGSAQAVKWEPETSSPVRAATNGAVVLARELRHGQRYTVWSYVPRASPKALARTGTDYPEAASEYLRVAEDDDVRPVPRFGTVGRDAEMRRFFGEEFYLEDHRRVYNVARAVTDEAESPYEAAVMLEAWFRGGEGGFVYDESPPAAGAFEAPLVFFLRSKRGYCQQFAGTMALMLRYIGVPARVAAGFTSGSYDAGKHEWTVTDHNAHTWVEVYFPRFGWVPFDPTPNRGQLTAAYTPFSQAFDVRDAAGLGALRGVPEISRQVDRASGLESREPNPAGGEGGGVPGAVTDTGRSLLGILFVVVALGVVGIVAVKEARRRARFLARDPRALAGACRRDLIGFLADQGVEVPPSATLAELGELVERGFRVNAAPLVEALTEARYGRPRDGRARARRARTELRRLRRRMRGELAFAERVRGALSVRSLTA